MANKADKEEKMMPEEISKAMRLDEITDRNWAIYGTSAKSGKGVDEAMRWLANNI